MKLVQLAAMILFTLVTGVFWGTWFSLSRSIASITPGTFLEVGHTMIDNLGGPMSLLIPTTIAVMIVLLIILHRRHDRAAFTLATVSLALLVAALAITLTVNVPIDNQIAGWTETALPGDWQATRNRWEFYHGLRTALALVGIACLFASSVWTRQHRSTLGDRASRAA